MSSSPKYSEVWLETEQERRLLKERERQAWLEREWRMAEEARMKAQRSARVRSEAQRDLSALQGKLETFSTTEAARSVSAELDALRERILSQKAAIDAVSGEARVRQASDDIRRLRDDLGQVIARGEAAGFASRLAREEALAVELSGRLAAMEQARSERFDGQGLQELKALLSRLRSALDRRSPAEAGELAALAGAHLERHQAEVEARYSRWREEKERAGEAVTQVSDCLAGLEADEVVIRWVAPDVKAFAERVSETSAMLEAEEFAQARDAAAALAQEAERIVAKAQEFQLKDDRRQYIVQGIVQVMQQMGFVVQSGFPALEHPSVPASATIIQARRLGGGAMAVSVPQEGDIWYDVGGFPMRLEAGSGGRPVKTCDETEEQIEKMHSAMEQAFGIKMGELMWEGKDPNRIRKAAERLPDSAAGSRRRGGGE